MTKQRATISASFETLSGAVLVGIGIIAIALTYSLASQNQTYANYIGDRQASEQAVQDTLHALDLYMLEDAQSHNHEENTEHSKIKNILGNIRDALKSYRADIEEKYHIKSEGSFGALMGSLSMLEVKLAGSNHSHVNNALNDKKIIDFTHQAEEYLDTSSSTGYKMFIKSIQRKQFSLYLGISIMVITGLFIFLRNNQKIRKLNTAAEEKNQVMSLMENRVAAIEASQEGICMINGNNEITYMNTAMLDIYGIPLEAEDQFIGESWNRLYPEKTQTLLENEVMPALEQHKYWQGNIAVEREGGKPVHLDIAFTGLPDGGFIVMTRDVTERYRNEKDKKALEEQFYQAQKMEAVGRLAGGIAHDFNNILAAINGYAEFLEEDLEGDADKQKFAIKILAAGREAKSLVDQLMNFSRRQDSTLTTLDLKDCIKDTLSILKASLPKSIEVKYTTEAQTTEIEGNATQIKQALMNLCVNARDAIEDEKGIIEINLTQKKGKEFPLMQAIIGELPNPKEQPFTRIEEEDNGTVRLVMGEVSRKHDYVCISIKDSGCGMARIIVEHMFEPFFTTKDVNKGTGLGMANVHGVLVGHQAAMLLETCVGKGTTFNLYFPISESLGKDKSSEEAEAKGINKIDNNKIKILLVEDQENVRDMLTNMLERLGFQHHACDSGLTALDHLRENPETYDLVITDQNMPNMSGIELITQVHFDFPELPFILVSGYSEQRMQEMIEDHEAVKAFLKKPVSKDTLHEKIINVVKQKLSKAA